MAGNPGQQQQRRRATLAVVPVLLLVVIGLTTSWILWMASFAWYIVVVILTLLLIITALYVWRTRKILPTNIVVVAVLLLIPFSWIVFGWRASWKFDWYIPIISLLMLILVALYALYVRYAERTLSAKVEIIVVLLFISVPVSETLRRMGFAWYIVIAPTLVLVFPLLFFYVRYAEWPAWTGFGEYTKISKELTPSESKMIEEPLPRKTLWDWMQLLLIPLVLAVVAASVVAWFTAQQNQISISATQRQHDFDVTAAADQQQEETLKTYIGDISSLKLQASTPNSADRTVARARTLEALRRLDQGRKGALLQFLYEAQLLYKNEYIKGREGPIISLEGADLSKADLKGLDLPGIDLDQANLYGAQLQKALLWDSSMKSADLSNADLSGANLNGAFLWGADLQHAHLQGTQEVSACLFGANLNGADLSETTDLSGANLIYAQLKGVNLRGARLKWAYLGGADLTGADLTGADLTGANVPDPDRIKATNIQEQSKQADKIQWELIQGGNLLLIAHKSNSGKALTEYGELHLDNSMLQLSYGPSSDWGTSVILLPTLWSQMSCSQSPLKGYCQNAPVTLQDAQGHDIHTAPEIPVVQQITTQNATLFIHGTIAGLDVTLKLQLFEPTDNYHIRARVTTTHVSGNVVLDTHPQNDAFRPLMLSSMHISASQWASQKAYADEQPFTLPNPGDTWIIQPSQVAQKFGLIGGASSWEQSAPSIEVQLEQPQLMWITGWVSESSNPNNDNVVFWCGSNKKLDSWSYTLLVSESPGA